MTSIRPIDAASVHRICSGQVVLDLAGAVKELVENALDAGATVVEVRLREHGCELIEVADNGSGVCPEHYEALTAKYHTSKVRGRKLRAEAVALTRLQLSSFADLASLSTFGFRGEALSSHCSLCDLSVVTRTPLEVCPVARTSCEARSQEAASHRSVERGWTTTTMAASRARFLRHVPSGQRSFSSPYFRLYPFGTRRVPVPRCRTLSYLPAVCRTQELTRNVKREYGKLLALLQAYALICNARLVVTHATGRAPRATVIHTQGAGCALRENIITVLGAKAMAGLQAFDATLFAGCTVSGFVSLPAPGAGRATGDRQFFYLNGRPVDLPRLAKALKEVYQSFNASQAPVAVLDVRLSTDAYDVNITPDKRRVMLHMEDELLASFQQCLRAAYEPSRATFEVGCTATLEARPRKRVRSDHTLAPASSPGADKEWVSDNAAAALEMQDAVLVAPQPQGAGAQALPAGRMAIGDNARRTPWPQPSLYTAAAVADCDGTPPILAGFASTRVVGALDDGSGRNLPGIGDAAVELASDDGIVLPSLLDILNDDALAAPLPDGIAGCGPTIPFDLGTMQVRCFTRSLTAANAATTVIAPHPHSEP